MDPQTELLLRKSALDEGVLLDNVDDLIFGFHAQQAIEKPLKALLAQLGRQYPRTHDLERLAFLLGNAGESLPPTPALLTDFERLRCRVSLRRASSSPQPGPQQS